MKIKRILSVLAAAAMLGTVSSATVGCAPQRSTVSSPAPGAGEETSVTASGENYEKNLEKAKQLLAEAGYPDGKGLPVIEYTYNPGNIHGDVAEAVQQMWGNLGATVTVNSQEWSTFLNNRKHGDFMAARDGWLGDYTDPISLLDLFVTGGGNNDVQYSNPDYDALIAKIKSSPDNKERFALMHQAEDILMTNNVFANILYYTDYYMLDPKFDGQVWTSPLGWRFLQHADTDEISGVFGPTPDTIDPALNTSVDGGIYILHAFDGLMRWDNTNTIVPALAESYDLSDDGLNYVFHLRGNLKWSDGTPLTAHDFEYSWKRAVNPDTAADYENMYQIVKGYDEARNGDLDALAVKAIDDNTLSVALSAPAPYFLELAAFPALMPVNKAAVEKYGDAWATNPESYITCGAYFMTEFTPGSKIVFEKNDNYWDKDSVIPKKITFVLTEDQNSQLNGFQQGTLQIIDDVPTNEYDTLKNDPAFHAEAQFGSYYIAFNNQKAPFDNPKVREAFSLAIDRKFLSESVAKGWIPADAWVAPGAKGPDGKDFRESGKSYITS